MRPRPDDGLNGTRQGQTQGGVTANHVRVETPSSTAYDSVHRSPIHSSVTKKCSIRSSDPAISSNETKACQAQNSGQTLCTIHSTIATPVHSHNHAYCDTVHEAQLHSTDTGTSSDHDNISSATCTNTSGTAEPRANSERCDAKQAGSDNCTTRYIAPTEWRALQVESQIGYISPDKDGNIQALELVSPRQFSKVINEKWPWPTVKAHQAFPEFMETYYDVRSTGLPNYLAARRPLKSYLNIPAWRHNLVDYEDNVLCEYLEFGWPISYTADRIPTSTMTNHGSAQDYPQQIEAFLQKELDLGAMLGPFTEFPFTPWTQISPIMTRPKKDTSARRIILDLSFPTGASVNAGIQKNTFEGEIIQYTLPAVSDLTDMVIRMGPKGYIWKADLERAYRQLRVDPLAVPLLGMAHRGRIFVDICPSFGCRTSGVSQQRVSQAITYLMNKRGFSCLAYVDDFCGLEVSLEEATRAFNVFHEICTDLGLAIAHEKSAAPTQTIEWLGFYIDTVNMVLKIPDQKIQDLIQETKSWKFRQTATRRELQCLAGRLSHMTACIKHSRKFISRILFQLRNTPSGVRKPVTTETRKDIQWFHDCALVLNCKRLLCPVLKKVVIECDACPTGGGGFLDGHYYDLCFPEPWAQRHHISRLEAVNILIAIKSLAPRDTGPYELVIKTDNSPSAYVLVSGKTHDHILAACAREIAYFAIREQIEITIHHVPGESLVLADALSRRHKDQSMDRRAVDITANSNMNRIQVCDLNNILDVDL